MALTNNDIQTLANLIDTKLDQKLQPINNELVNINSRLDKIESEVSALHANQIEFNKELKKLDCKVSDTYELALEAWGTSTENRMWLKSDKLKV
ncbi:MAG: hypothetical protein K2N82_08810 [Lachnospiraceae bacterium]|nr:hypothetical protein [Lachnospiraceae bacterium]